MAPRGMVLRIAPQLVAASHPLVTEQPAETKYLSPSLEALGEQVFIVKEYSHSFEKRVSSLWLPVEASFRTSPKDVSECTL